MADEQKYKWKDIYKILFIVATIIICLTKTYADKNNAQEFVQDCVVDEIGCIEDKKIVEKELKHFHSTTGLQPYVVLSKESPESQEEAEKWIEKYSNPNFANRSDVVFYVYFANGQDCLSYGEHVKKKYDNSLSFGGPFHITIKSLFKKAMEKNMYEDKSKMICYLFSETSAWVENVEQLTDAFLFFFLFFCGSSQELIIIVLAFFVVFRFLH